MGPVSVTDQPEILHHGRRRVLMMIAIIVAGCAGVGAALVLGSESQATCSSATSPLGHFADEPQLPRLCQLGAPSRLIGSGRVDGVSWREVATPPRPWAAYQGAGFDLPASMSGRDGSCIVEVVSSPRGDFSDGCGQWAPLGPVGAGHFFARSCDHQVIMVYDAILLQRADHFVLRLINGTSLMLRSVTFHGRSYAAFALRPGQQVRSLTAYDVSGKPLASETGTGFGTC